MHAFHAAHWPTWKNLEFTVSKTLDLSDRERFHREVQHKLNSIITIELSKRAIFIYLILRHEGA